MRHPSKRLHKAKLTIEPQSIVNLDTLSVQQLTQVKNQLDQELEHLTTSFTQLQAAQSKFRDCLRCVQGGKASALKGAVPIPDPRPRAFTVALCPPISFRPKLPKLQSYYPATPDLKLGNENWKRRTPPI